MNSEPGIVQDALDQFGPIRPFKPFASYDPEGDCIEFFWSNESFLARRLDCWVTIYHGETTGEITGGLIKNIAGLKNKYPAIEFQVRGKPVSVAFVLRAPSYSTQDETVFKKYESIIEKAERESLFAELQPA